MSDSPPDYWYEPPEIHELDTCFDCHDNGLHEPEITWWSQHGCVGCEEEVLKEIKENG